MISKPMGNPGIKRFKRTQKRELAAGGIYMSLETEKTLETLMVSL